VLICFRHTEQIKTPHTIEKINTDILNSIGDFFGGFVTRIISYNRSKKKNITTMSKERKRIEGKIKIDSSKKNISTCSSHTSP